MLAIKFGDTEQEHPEKKKTAHKNRAVAVIEPSSQHGHCLRRHLRPRSSLRGRDGRYTAVYNPSFGLRVVVRAQLSLRRRRLDFSSSSAA